ncbi:MAG TPA: imidazolonepropionase, partial [Mycobacterium sp.]|nr:imidazolonepropionase [Mycobacterium sp.]
MTTLYTDIDELVTNDPIQGDGSPLGIIADAALVVDGEKIAWVGSRADAPAADHRVSCAHTSVIPGFVDSHAHLVFAGERSAEFAARMSGEPYGAGGISSTVAATRAADDAALRAGVARLAAELTCAGVTTFETKSGYGLTVADEARSLKIAAAVTDETTFLGAHMVPAEFRDDRDGYIDLVVGPMLDACAPAARWVDVFCDRGAFDVDEARHILTAGMAAGLTPRLHAGQLGPSGGIRLAVDLGAASVDHCTYATDADVEALAGSPTVATLLPGAEFSTRAQWPDAKRFLDAGVTVALATDCNPGSSFTTSMAFCIAVAVRDMKFTPAQALWSATAGGAAA